MTRGLFGSGAGGYTVRDNPKEYFSTYYKKNKERIRKRQKASYDANPEKFRAYTRAYYQKKLTKEREIYMEAREKKK